MGIIIGEKDCWGKGFATETLRLLVDFAFQTLQLKKLTAGCYGGNTGSEKSFQKAGFVIEGSRPAHFWYNEQWVDMIFMGAVNENH